MMREREEEKERERERKERQRQGDRVKKEGESISELCKGKF